VYRDHGANRPANGGPILRCPSGPQDDESATQPPTAVVEPGHSNGPRNHPTTHRNHSRL